MKKLITSIFVLTCCVMLASCGTNGSTTMDNGNDTNGIQGETSGSVNKEEHNGGDAAKDAADGAGNAVKDAADGVGNAAKDVVDGTENAVDDAVNGAENAADNVAGGR